MLSLVVGAASLLPGAPVVPPSVRSARMPSLVMQETEEAAPAEAPAAPAYNIGRTDVPMSQAIPFLTRPAGLGAPGTHAGDVGFDPAGITELVPFNWLREAELKHARVCMLAWAGWVAVDAGFRVPFAPAVTSLYAHDAAVERGPMLAMLIPLAAIELLAGVPKCFQLLNDPDAAPGGDYFFDPLGFGGGRELEEKELANGRAAIIGFSGTVTQAVLTGNGFPYTYDGLGGIIPPLTTTDLPLPAICASGLANGCQ